MLRKIFYFFIISFLFFLFIRENIPRKIGLYLGIIFLFCLPVFWINLQWGRIFIIILYLRGILILIFFSLLVLPSRKRTKKKKSNFFLFYLIFIISFSSCNFFEKENTIFFLLENFLFLFVLIILFLILLLISVRSLFSSGKPQRVS